MTESEAPFVSIIIPAYNEVRRLPPTIEKIDAYLAQQKYSSEVIIVNDFSTDDTLPVISKFIDGKKRFRLISNDARKRHGKGGAVKRGMSEAKGRYKLFSDADLSTPIE